MYARHITPLLLEALADTPVIFINGARQTGKSTLAQVPEIHHYRYLTLDNPVVLAAAKNDPSGFIEALDGPVVLDEVQRAPELFLPIKAAVDRDRRPGRFLLTGSAHVLLLPTIADSLAGRMEILSLWPLSTAELAGISKFNRADWLFNGELNALAISACKRERWIDILLAGGFPEAVSRSSEKRRAAWFDSYLHAILQRDVRELANLEQLSEIPNLLQLLAARSANLLNFAELSRSIGLTQTTLKRYFSLLEVLFLVYRLPAWHRNAGKRLVKAPKVFVLDSGLLAHLNHLSKNHLMKEAGLPGGLVETFVLNELLKHLAFAEQKLTLWHYRTQTNYKVDFVLENRLGQITGIEVKANSTVTSNDFKGLRHLQQNEPQAFQRGIVLYDGPEIVPFSPHLFAVPLSMWWAQENPSE
ncbi:MAG: hypothetical protein ON057_000775 [Glomeribacter sp. 1016415]|nr:hypothetical protein [Glomeribacter sp. 1016415]